MIITKTDKLGQAQTDILSEDFTNNRRIWVTGEINSETAKEFIVELDYLDRVSRVPADITVYFDSPGGSVADGLAMLDAMKRCKCPVVTVATGIAASMAAFLAACGGTKGRRYVTRNAEVMIHQPLGGITGQATEIELCAQRILKKKALLNRYLAEATGRTVEQIAQDTDRDHFMTAEEAVAYGLADEII